MEEHPIQGLMTTAMENLKDMVEVNTIIGDAIESPDGSVIIPVSKLGFGFAAGGSEFVSSNSQGSEDGGSMPFGGGSGGGVSITPVAFLIVSPKGIKMVHLDENTHIYEKMIDFAPKAVEKIQQLLKESSSGGDKKSKDKSKEGKEDKEDKKGKKSRKKRSKEEEPEDEESEEEDDEMEYDI
ncbi:GerW family sporulation protein [Ornithinibacillus halophilus]|uniref:Sporulation protein YtfJ n=1 Tax=Ornithinibacillus halophilus TaxID=930117 RepID=A0A1M5EJF2_9BACI|nr:GerW family sporulation protein [Ornithinibacillus halophilus]SHF79250.1 sporulation protein YtfJ [Ornithinibacillus halophilus]